MKAHCLPFNRIPHTTRLFADFLAYTPAVREFYPNSPYFGEWAQQQATQLRYDAARRGQVSKILQRQNLLWNGSPQTSSNVDRFRKGAAAIVTGQQVGLFGGPMFAMFKAMSAVKLAEEATARGIEAVPVFWLATYDHDLAEVNHISLPANDGTMTTVSAASHGIAGAPVSDVRLGDEILPAVEEVARLLGDSEVTTFLRESYRPGESLGTAFAKFFARLFGPWGVIILDASDPEFHQVAEPIYRAAVERIDEIDASLLARGKALEKAGYHEQVKVGSSSVPLFVIRDGVRTAIQRSISDSNHTNEFSIGEGISAEKISAADLAQRIATEPGAFSPNVLLRPVVQDYLLPTLAYAGGAAEIAYFAQAAVLYEILLGRVTPAVPRFSATLVEPKVQRWLQQYQISVPETFLPEEELRRKLATLTLPEGIVAAFDLAQDSIKKSFGSLRKGLEELDPTLLGASQTAESKMDHQLERLRKLATSAELRRNDVISRHAKGLSQALYPDGALQERGVAGVYFLARHGTQLLSDIHEAVRSDCRDHQVLEL